MIRPDLQFVTSSLEPYRQVAPVLMPLAQDELNSAGFLAAL